MPALGPTLTREVRRLTSAYHAYPGPVTSSPDEVLAWYDAQQRRAYGEQLDQPGDTHPGSALGRRRFLQGSAVIGIGAVGAGLLAQPSRALAGTTSPKVIVIGAGLAGLSCTYRLHQNGITAVLHEAQERVGGRCYSIRDFFDAGQTAEHGGQYIDSRHKQFRALAAELGVELVDTFAQSFPAGSNSYRWIDGALRSSNEVFADYGVFLTKLKADYKRAGDYRWNKAGPAAIAIDNRPMTQWFDRNIPGGSNSLLGRALGAFQQSFFGLEPSEMSTINLFEAYLAPYPGANERYRVAGGNDGMVRALEAALPAGAIRRGSVLEAAWTRNDGRIGLSFSNKARDIV
ncbi:MAG: FAD-dependent oxidoreductase, partial [Actinomycetes bacterium]